MQSLQRQASAGARSGAVARARATRVASTVTMAPTAAPTVRPEFKAQLDAAVSTLQFNKAGWVALPLPEKVSLLKEVQARLLDNVSSWGKAGAALRGLDKDGSAVAEATLITPVVVQNYCASLIDTLEALHTTGACLPVPTRTTPSGQVVAKVYPSTPKDLSASNPLTAGLTAELYIQPGKPASQGAVYLNPNREGTVAALLGAGNLGFLGLKDILYSLYECNHVVLFKPHPIQAEWHKFADYVLEPLWRRGYYRSVYTDSVAETQAMLYHKGVEHVHMTGGTATHDAIVWGSTPEEQARRKAANDPLLRVPITSELGCVSPWIVTPGQWTEEQLAVQALDAAHGLTVNNSCCCNALKVLVLPQQWPQADAFLSKVKESLRGIPLAPSFYPGIKQRYESWQAVFGNAEVVSASVTPSSKDFQCSPQPYLIQEVPYPEPGQELTERQQYAFTVEPFAPVMIVVRVPSADTPDFLQKATSFCNDRLWGTLSCTVLLHPDTEQGHAAAAQQMLDDLKYGSVVCNAWSALGYSTPHCTWGAYAGDQTIKNIGSGTGHINNTLLFDHSQKTVIKSPMVGSHVPAPLSKMGLPTFAVKPLTGLLVGGPVGVFKALFSK